MWSVITIEYKEVILLQMECLGDKSVSVFQYFLLHPIHSLLQCISIVTLYTLFASTSHSIMMLA